MVPDADYEALVSENQKLNLREIREKKTSLESRPSFFNIDLMGVCNMKPYCVMCPIDDQATRHHDGMKVDEILAFGDFLNKACVVTNCGIGEPTIHHEIVRLARELSTRKKVFGFNSNGLSFTPELSDQLMPYANYLEICFSLDAASPQTFTKVRGRDWDLVLSNLQYFCKKRAQLDYKPMAHLGLSFLMMRCNRHELEQFFVLGQSLPVDMIVFRSLVEYGWTRERVREQNGFIFDYDEQILSYEELEEVRLLGEDYGRKYGVEFVCQYRADQKGTYDFFVPHDYRQNGLPCAQPFQFILPFNDGRVVPCCYIEESFGDWRKQSLESIWNNKRWQALRRTLLEGDLPGICRHTLSCPVTKAWKEHKKGKPYRTDADGVVHFDPHYFAGYETEGLLPLEWSLSEDEPFHWLGPRAKIQLPTPFTDEPFVMQIHVLCPRRELHIHPLRLDVSLNGHVELQEFIANSHRQVFSIRGHKLSGEYTELAFESADAWFPRDFFPGTKDDRLVTVALMSVSIRRQRP